VIDHDVAEGWWQWWAEFDDENLGNQSIENALSILLMLPKNPPGPF
jgi:hypothetical protein